MRRDYNESTGEEERRRKWKEGEAEEVNKYRRKSMDLGGILKGHHVFFLLLLKSAPPPSPPSYQLTQP
jgi:hypothetical protein